MKKSSHSGSSRSANDPTSRSPTDPVTIGLTVGDAAGIGPEIILASLAERTTPTVVYGHRRIFALQMTLANSLDLPIEVLTLEQWRAQAHTPPRSHTLIDLDARLPREARAQIDALERLPYGQPCAAFAHLQGLALEVAIDDALAGRIDAVTTAPLTKSLFALAGRPTTGHTEILGARTHSPDHVMMLAGDVLRVALVTTHLPISRVSSALSVERIVSTICTTAAELRARFGLPTPRIAVAALNPHAGEAGTMGREELDVIAPAIEAASTRLEDVTLSGPLPADTLFANAPRPGWSFDAVVCMYHDQALIPLKLMHFGRSANITLGLPIIRTSVDHGTAYDIAGTSAADHRSLLYAIDVAHEMVALQRAAS